MALTEDQVEAAVHRALERQREARRVEPEQHFLDHDMLKTCRADRDRWRRNHEFIEGMIDSTVMAKKIGIGGMLTAVGGLALWVIKLAWGAALTGPK